MFFDTIKRGWETWVPTFILLCLVACFVVHAGKYKDFRFRATFVTVMIQMTLCLYGMNVEILYNLFPYLCALIVLTGLYGIVELPSIFSISILFLFFYHIVILEKIPYETSEQIFKILCQLLNMLCIVFLVRFCLKEREKSSIQSLKTIEELKEAERSKDDFLANISHEIRTPINTICGMSESVLQEQNVEKMREDVHYIQTAGRNLMSVVSDILDFSELQSGKLAMESEAYNITSTINDIINMTLAKIKDKNIELVVDCDATIPSGLQGDEKKIRRVIMNLVDNAIKFTKDGCVSIVISWRKEEYGINLIISVEDTGIGMKEESIEKIFKSFSQVDVRRNRQNGGVGLGLAISQSIVQMMGGVINIKSKFGKGTKIKFVVPQKVLDERPIASINNQEQINIGIYIDMEQFSMMEIRDQYSSNIRHMVEQMQVKCHMCRNLSELKRRVEREKFSHVFISMVEYKEDMAYFDELALKTKVIIILYRCDEKKIANPNFQYLYKPFYIIPIVSLLNKEIDEKACTYLNRKAKMTAPKAHVLIVDDNFMNLKVMEGILKKYQLKVSTAMSGKEALEKINAKTYDLVFMDHMMPEMDGIETFHRIRNKGGLYFEKVPIIALTANAIAGAREMFLAEGFTDFLEKPVENSVLQRVLLRNLPEEKICFGEAREERQAERTNLNDGSQEEVENIEASLQKETKLETTNVEINSLEKAKQETTNIEAKALDESKRETTSVEINQLNESKQEATNAEVNQLKDANTEFAGMEKNQQKETETASKEELVIGDLDVQKGILYCDGKENYLMILKLTCDTLEENQRRVQQLYEQENWQEYIIMVHGIKSSMFTIGAVPLSELAKQLELEGKNGNIDFIRKNHNVMIQEYERVSKMLFEDPILCPDKKEKVIEQQIPILDESVFDQYYQALEAAMYDFNEEKMLKLLKEMQEYQYCGTSLKNPLDKLIRKVKMSDYMSAVEKVAELKATLERNEKGAGNHVE